MCEGILWSEFASFCVSPTNCPCCFVYIPTKCALPEMVHLAYAVLCTNAANRVLTEVVHFTYTVLCANATMDLQRWSTLPLQFCVPMHTNNKPCMHLLRCSTLPILVYQCDKQCRHLLRCSTLPLTFCVPMHTLTEMVHIALTCTNVTNNTCTH